MYLFRHADELRARMLDWRLKGERIGFVPTMGNLHEGHISLLDVARRHADRVVVSVFVNPLQFGPKEDFEAYPRTEDADRDMLVAAGADALFLPTTEEMYPDGLDSITYVEVPELSDKLCGAVRPGHFRGVTTIVSKLFNLVQPDGAVFGEKDWQQFVILSRMARDLCFPIEIYGAPTKREADGLAMSSRNRYLAPAERVIAPALYQTLRQTLTGLSSGCRDFEALMRSGHDALESAGFRPDYFEIREAHGLGPPGPDGSWVVMAAAWLGKARLIDNLRVESPAG